MSRHPYNFRPRCEQILEQSAMRNISVPGRVWDDFLNPDVSEMEHDLGLPARERIRAGRGYKILYRDVQPTVALDLAEYLHDRADTLLGQSIDDPYDPFEKAARDTYRAALKTAATIRARA